MNKIIEFSEEIQECKCGNNDRGEGFFPCLENGEIIEPTLDSGWKDLYKCVRCGQIYRHVEK